MHDPVHSIAKRGSAAIENEGLSKSHYRGRRRRRLAGDFPVFASGFPVPRFGGSVGSRSIWVFSIAWAEEEPLHVSFWKERFLCYRFTNKQLRNRVKKKTEQSRTEGLKWGTWELPWVEFVQINDWNDFEFNWKAFDFPFQIITHQFFICWVEPEAWWKRPTSHFVCFATPRTKRKRFEKQQTQHTRELAKSGGFWCMEN